jgi:hypothetical protein
MTRFLSTLSLAITFLACIAANAQEQLARQQPTAAELSRDETPGKAIMRTFEFQEYDVRSAAEAMPEDKWVFRPAPGMADA